MGGGSDLTLAAPFPDDPLDPVDPQDTLMNSKNTVFIVRFVNLAKTALSRCVFAGFLRTPCTKHILLGPKSQHIHEQGLENSPDFASATVQLRISLRTSWD